MSIEHARTYAPEVAEVDVSGSDVLAAPDLTVSEARTLTDRIRQTLRVGHDLIIEAFQGRAWAALGYDTWDAYCAGEFADARMVRLERDQRREIVAEMRDAGMSTRAISSATGVPPRTVAYDAAATVPNGTPATASRVTGLDGRTYAPTRFTAPEVVVDAEVVDTTTGEIGPEPPQRQPNRRPLPDEFLTAVMDLQRSVERVARLVADDRFPRNAEQVATKYGSDLTRARDVLSDVLDRF